MKRPKLRKTSKRMTCSKKYRIRKNVANHNRKMRKLSKINPGKYASSKDPGVPSSAPFKIDVLQEAEMRKQRIEEEKRHKKEERLAAVNKRRGLELLQQDALNRQEEFKNTNETDIAASTDELPGKKLKKEKSRKAYYKEFQKVVQNSDVILEVLDARDPIGCRCLEMEKMIIDAGNKKIVLLLNKIDLVPKQNVEEWLKYLRSEFPTVAFKSNTQVQQRHLSHYKKPIKTIRHEILSNTSQCVGADSLLKLLSNYCRNKDLQTSITVGVVGFPNVGKSSVINSLKRTRACNVGAMPGITKTMQEVSINKHIKIYDCPGIVMATNESASAIVLRNCVKISSLQDPVTPVEAILSRCKKDEVMLKYGVADYKDGNEFLELLARKKGMLRKGGIPKIDAAAKQVLHDWNDGRITYYTHPPEEKKIVHLEAKIVEEMANEFDWESLEKDNEIALKSVLGCPTHGGSILYESEGPVPVKVGDQVKRGTGAVEDATNDVSATDEDVTPAAPVLPSNITIGVNEGKKKKSDKNGVTEETKVLPVDGLEQIVSEGRNIQANQSLKQLIKLNKKKRKRADKLSDKLGESLISAMDISSAPTSQDYDFNVDFSA